MKPEHARALIDELDEWRARCADLERMLKGDKFERRVVALRGALGIAPMRARYLALLLNREGVSTDGFYQIFHNDQLGETDPKTIDVHMSSVRGALRKFDIELGHEWGGRWFLTRGAKRQVLDLIGEEMPS